jgi:lambda family phage minor tail protein L|tara:strand:+ start:709 stop:1986 length:1278 start_codon:yes stop_codon:yes gene_type:complete
MAEKIAIKQVQGLEQSSPIVILFEIDVLGDNNEANFLRFVKSADDEASSFANITMKQRSSPHTNRTYTALPISAQGFEHKSLGVSSRPTLSIANVTTAFTTALGSTTLDDLLGKKVYRRRTLKKYLAGEVGDTGSGVAPIEFPVQTYIIDRIEGENALEVTFELTTPFNVEGVTLPYRVVGHNACSWQYQGASPGRNTQKGGCTWHLKSTYNLRGKVFTVYVNEDDEYVISSSNTFTSYTAGTKTADTYHSTTVAYSNGAAGGVYRLKADGSFDTSTTGNLTNYWQAVRDTSATPSDSSADWNRIRVYQAYSNSTTWYAYSDDRYNDYVTSTITIDGLSHTALWKAKKTQAAGGSQVAPGFNEYWEKGDICGKRLSSCQCRFGFNPITPGDGTVATASATDTGKATKDTELPLPFGGFPGARKFK